jgi:uncharacterized Ntn-hydrolase superfamily protein
MRKRWFGATGLRVPQIAVEGDPAVPVEDALVLDDVSDLERMREAHSSGTPVLVRAATAKQVQAALARPEVAAVLVPASSAELVELDLTELTYGNGTVATYSLAACDLEAGQWGVAVQSKFLAVGAIVPWAEPNAGAVATQAHANARYGPDGLALLREGRTAQEVVERLTGGDDGRAKRQLGVVDAQGGSATYTGEECLEWAGGRTGPGYAAQGNILVSRETVDALADTFAGSRRPLAERLLDSLAAAQAAGGDRRGQQSAALLVVEQGAGYAGLSDTLVDLRVDDHERPVDELRRLYALHRLLFVPTPPGEWLRVDEVLASELRERLARLGYEGELGEAFDRWAGVENLEERVDGIERVDPVVLEELRRRSL